VWHKSTRCPAGTCAPAVRPARGPQRPALSRTGANLLYAPCPRVCAEIASDELKGRVFEINLGDLKDNNEGYTKVKLICEEVQGKNVLTNFYGLSFTRDKISSLIRKCVVGAVGRGRRAQCGCWPSGLLPPTVEPATRCSRWLPVPPPARAPAAPADVLTARVVVARVWAARAGVLRGCCKQVADPH
jgi:hypothetical protein